MRSRTGRSAPERAFPPRQNYTRHDEADVRGVRYNSPPRYRDYVHSSARDPKDVYISREFNHRDYNPHRESNHRDYYDRRDSHRNYPVSSDYDNLRDYPVSRDHTSNSRDYVGASRDHHHFKWDHHTGDRDSYSYRDFHNSRDFHSSRDYNSSREYPQNYRDSNRYRDNGHVYRSYPHSSRSAVDHDSYHQDRRVHRDRNGPYERRPPVSRQSLRKTESQSQDHDSKKSSSARQTSAQPNKTKVFIGNLSGEVTQDELTTKFSTFGPINRIDFRRKFAFIDFVRSKDAETAIREMHNKLIWGSWIKVQPHIENQKKITSRDPKPNFQITVTNLDQSVSWQDLKDFARQVGEVRYASIIIKGNRKFGLIEFSTDEAVKQAMRELNGKRIASNKLELIHIPVSEFLKNLGYNNDNLVVEENNEDMYSNGSLNDVQINDNDRLDNDTFEAEEFTKSPSPSQTSGRNSLYQEETLETVDYN